MAVAVEAVQSRLVGTREVFGLGVGGPQWNLNGGSCKASVTRLFLALEFTCISEEHRLLVIQQLLVRRSATGDNPVTTRDDLPFVQDFYQLRAGLRLCRG